MFPGGTPEGLARPPHPLYPIGGHIEFASDPAILCGLLHEWDVGRGSTVYVPGVSIVSAPDGERAEGEASITPEGDPCPMC